ncbi:hypothetical protein HK100_010329 [Physocladia obscura]|uniref:At4g15545-like C-terminal domain-containing protein n=1 Tax=Physocladia obscura TaxID=109957 RepID=A0AAD5T5D1_9FUNG|nr:hypothetical protein HK100_010329 [Physocladia obscura]
MSQLHQDLETCIAQLRNCFGKVLAESNAETLNLRYELAQRDTQIKDLTAQLANIKSRLAHAERAAAKLALFKNVVLTQLQNQTETDGSEIDVDKSNYGTISPVFATRSNNSNNLGQANSIDILMAGIDLHHKQLVDLHNNNNNNIASLPLAKSLTLDLTAINNTDRSSAAASTENNNNNEHDYNNNNRNSVGNISLDMTTPLLQSKSSPISNITFERSRCVRNAQTPSSSTATTSTMAVSNTDCDSSSNRNTPTVAFALNKTSAAADIESPLSPNRNGSATKDKNSGNPEFYTNRTSNGGNGTNSGGGAGLGSVDGREFFKLARTRLSYDDFTNLLNSVKAYNARDQSRQQTVESLRLLLNKDLFEQFEQLLSK